MTAATRGRILFVALQTGNRSDGGLESATRIFEQLAPDYDWEFVTTHETWFTDRWRAGGARVSVARFDERAPRPAKLGRFVAWAGRLAAVALGRRPDVIHANDPRAFQAALPAARVAACPLLLTIRDTKPEGVPVGPQWHAAVRYCRRIVTLSDSMGGFVAARTGATAAQLRTIPSMVDLAAFRPPAPAERDRQRTRLGIGTGEFAVGSVGVIRDKKNQLELLERTLPALRGAVPGARLHFFGDYAPEADGYARRFADAITRHGLGAAVVMHGHQAGMAANYQALDALVIGSRNEGLARCMIEGMATGVPVVSFDVCSAAEMLTATGAGIVVPQGDHAGLAGALAELARNPERRAAMGGRGRAAAGQRFDPPAVAARYRQLYAEVLAG